MNLKEAYLVIQYIKELIKSGVREQDIGVVTPYRRQVRLIREKLQRTLIRKHHQIVVGSTEEFQGQERLVSNQNVSYWLFYLHSPLDRGSKGGVVMTVCYLKTFEARIS